MSVIGCVQAGILRWTRNDRSTQLGVGGEHAMEASQVQPGTRHQCAPRRCMNSSGEITTWGVPSG